MAVSAATRGEGRPTNDDDQTTMLVRKIPDGSVIDEPVTLARIRALVIPPAW